MFIRRSRAQIEDASRLDQVGEGAAQRRKFAGQGRRPRLRDGFDRGRERFDLAGPATALRPLLPWLSHRLRSAETKPRFELPAGQSLHALLLEQLSGPP